MNTTNPTNMYPFYHQAAHNKLGDKLAVGLYYLEELLKHVKPSVTVHATGNLTAKYQNQLHWVMEPIDKHTIIPISSTNRTFAVDEVTPFTPVLPASALYCLHEGRLSFGFDIVSNVSLGKTPVIYIDNVPVVTFGYGKLGEYLGNTDWDNPVLAALSTEVPLYDFAGYGTRGLSHCLELPSMVLRQINLLCSTMEYIQMIRLGGSTASLLDAIRFDKVSLDFSSPETHDVAKTILFNAAIRVHEAKQLGEDSKYLFYKRVFDWVNMLLSARINNQFYLKDDHLKVIVYLVPAVYVDKKQLVSTYVAHHFSDVPKPVGVTVEPESINITIDDSAFMETTRNLLERWLVPSLS